MTMIIVNDTVALWPFRSVACRAVALATAVPSGELLDLH
jgi:hypothetical protein